MIRTRRCRSAWQLSAAALPLVLAACGDVTQVQSAVDSAGPQAARIEALFWPMLWILSAAWVLTIGAVIYAVSHRRRRTPVAPHEPLEPDSERKLTIGVAGASGVSILILLGLLVAYFGTGRALAGIYDDDALVIELWGHQWWWEAHYQSPLHSDRLTTANEIHIPVGEPIMLRLRSSDVIHSFWVPNLHGKRDMIPGHQTSIWIQADKPGRYRGECAEFCGHAHAKMGLWVIAEPRPDFERWYRAQLEPAREPVDSLQRAGRDVFVGGTCLMCHTIRGTPANGKVAPDLTHLASRTSIAAGALPNTRGHLGGWILDPQSIKPGVRMPPNDISPRDLHALLSYLEGLR